MPIRSIENYQDLLARCKWRGKCLEFQHSDQRNYGRFRWGFKGKRTPAHRVSYILNNGEIPDGMLVMHTCDNPPCVNPKHLVLGTHRDNVQDAIHKGRWSMRKGEKAPASKLADKDIHKIREARRRGSTLGVIAKRYGITFENVHYIVNRKTWKHIYP